MRYSCTGADSTADHRRAETSESPQWGLESRDCPVAQEVSMKGIRSTKSAGPEVRLSPDLYVHAVMD